MKRTLAVMFASIAISALAVNHAHATFLCSNPHQTLGKVGTNPVFSTRVGIDTTSQKWFIFHTLTDGTVIDRSAQYSVASNPSSALGWKGYRLSGAPSLWMTGDMVPRTDGDHVTYVEELHDAKRGDMLVMRSEADCSPLHDAPAPVASNTPTSMPSTPATDDLPKAATDGSHTKSNFEAAYAKVVNDAKAQGFNMTTTCWKGYCMKYVRASYSDGFDSAMRVIYDSGEEVRQFCISKTGRDTDRNCVASTGAFWREHYNGKDWETTRTYADHFEDETSAPSA